MILQDAFDVGLSIDATFDFFVGVLLFKVVDCLFAVVEAAVAALGGEFVDNGADFGVAFVTVADFDKATFAFCFDGKLDFDGATFAVLGGDLDRVDFDSGRDFDGTTF